MTSSNGYARAQSSGSGNREPSMIVNVDPANRICTAMLRARYTVQVNTAYAVGDTIITPAKGEQWYVERLDREWRLAGRIPFNDPTLNIEAEEGQVSAGSASGPYELNGTEIRCNGPFRLGITLFSTDDNGKLQYSLDGTSWAPVGGAGGSGGGANIDSTDDLPEGSTNKYYTADRVSNDAPVKSVAFKTGNITLTKTDVGLSNVDNTSDNAKPISSATANALNLKADLVNNLVPTTQLPLPAVREYATSSAFPSPGSSGVLYIAKDNALLYRWDGSAFTLAGSAGGGGGSGISNTDSLPEGTNNRYYTDARVQAKINTMYGSTANSIAQGNDTRLADQRVPVDGSVTLAKVSSGVASSLAKADSALQSIADGSIGLAKLSATGVRNAATVLRGDNTWGVGSFTSGATMTRTLTTAFGNAAAGTFTMGNYFNNDLDHTADITVDLSTAKYTVSVSGIYLITVQYKYNNAAGSNGPIGPVLYKNGSVFRSGNLVASLDSNGFLINYTANSTWSLPLIAGENVQAGYSNAYAGANVFNGETTGRQAWFSIALLSSG